jgi:aspartyl-tRNA(Asn)/glutamyl-tRNA(Gln) amidotransferase subunit A
VNLYDLTIHELSNMLSNKEIGAVELVMAQYDRIDKVENKIQCYIELSKDIAIEKAEIAQKLINSKENKSPLLGIPMAIKDNMCTEGVKTTCASKMLHNFIPPYNATVVEKLDSAGAVMLGKLNMDEFAMGSSTENSSIKKTTNPWDIKRVPGGSSGGSAAAVAAGEAVFSLGSDTGGSIRQPASLCGVVGMKPTYGAISRYGLIAFASSLDQIGPFTKDITDCALVLNAICGHDSKDSTSVNIEFPDFTKSLVNNVKGMKIGIPKEYLGHGINPEVKATIEKAIAKYEELGAICEEFNLPETEYAIPAYYVISSAEASSNLARFDGVKYGYRSEKFKDLTDLYRESRSEGFGPEVKRRIMLGTYALSSGYYDAYYKKALQVKNLITQSFKRAFDKFDVVIGPTSPTTAFKFGEKSDNPMELYLCDIYTVAVNIAGLPGISIPCGFDSQNLPIGLQLIGKHFDESKILRAAYSFEQNTDYNKQRAKI